MATHTFTPTAEDTEAEAEAEAVGFLYSSQPGRATGRDPVSHKKKKQNIQTKQQGNRMKEQTLNKNLR